MQKMNRRSLLKTAPLAMLAGSKNLFGQNSKPSTVAQRGELDEFFDLLDHTLNLHVRQKERAFGVKLPIEKSVGIYGDNHGIPKSYFGIYSYWDKEDTLLDKEYGVAPQIEFYLSPEEEEYIMQKFANKYNTITQWIPRQEFPFNFNLSGKICDLYDESFINGFRGSTRQVGISVIENRQIRGSVSICREHIKNRRFDVIGREMEVLNKKIGGGLSGKKGILSLI
jgi:hypothetical protein